jgi:dipeptidyl aminopeptidase/acylaminoacyl peptidase
MKRGKTLIPRAVLFTDAEYFNPTISPDGRCLAYLKRDEGGLKFYVRTVGKTDDRAVSGHVRLGRMAFRWRWQHDNQHLLYLADNNGDENFHIYSLDINTGAARDLTPFAGTTASILEHLSDYPNIALIAINQRDRTVFDAYHLDLDSGKLEMAAQNPGDVDSGLGGTGWLADRSLNVRAALAVLSDGSREIRVRDTVDSPWRAIVTTCMDDMTGLVSFTSDEKGLLAVTSKDSNTVRVVRVDVASGAIKVISRDKKYDMGDMLMPLLLNPKTRQLQGACLTRDRIHWRFFDEPTREHFRSLEKLHRRGELHIVSRDLNDQRWTVAFMFDNAPVRYYVYNKRSMKATYLFSNDSALEGYKFAPMRCFSFKSRDGLDLHGYLVLPRGVKHRRLPMVINVHGGPWSRNRWMLDLQAQWMADRGYAVMYLNFRGSTGYGKAFVNAGDREWGAKMHDDVLDAKKWAVDQGFADPARVCIYGISYGGYAALVGVTFTPDEFACGIDVVGPSNLVTLLSTFPPYWKSSRAMFDRRVGNVVTEQEFLKSRSPVFKVEQIKVPLLIGQGANDPRVVQAESDQIVEAMRRNGKPVEYILFADEGHGFLRPVNKQKFHAAMEHFLAKYLGGACEPATASDDWQDVRK